MYFSLYSSWMAVTSFHIFIVTSAWMRWPIVLMRWWKGHSLLRLKYWSSFIDLKHKNQTTFNAALVILFCDLPKYKRKDFRIMCVICVCVSSTSCNVFRNRVSCSLFSFRWSLRKCSSRALFNCCAASSAHTCHLYKCAIDPLQKKRYLDAILPKYPRT